MIRFLNKEVYRVLYERLDRNALLDYFAQGNMDELVCVLNMDGSYRGWISYYSLFYSETVTDAVLEDSVVLDHEIWENAKQFFAHHMFCLNEHVLLPVRDQEGRLVCFVYEDGEANREIRMLRELGELSEVLSFADVYPQYDCVKICGCNELAVLFAGYLRKQGIAVVTEGELWEHFFCGDHVKVPDCRCLTIYAEGVEKSRSQTWTENLLRSVSSEFEYVDCIYEANIRKGIITAAMGDLEEWLAVLRHTDKEIAIWGIDAASQDMYDFLLTQGIESGYFISYMHEDRKYRMLGKKIISPLEIRSLIGRIIILDCVSENSAWGTDRLDYYDYLGVRRNHELFVVKDYMEIPHCNLKASLQSRRILLTGDIVLCGKIARYLRHTVNTGEILYADVLGENTGRSVYGDRALKQVKLEDIEKDILCLVVMPDMNLTTKELFFLEKKRELIRSLEENDLLDYTDYFSHIQPFIVMEKENEKAYREERFTAKKIILGAIDANCGNVFIKTLLDNHPSILMISDFAFYNNNLFWLSIRLADLPSEDMVESFEAICQTEYPIELKDKEAFIQKMRKLLVPGKQYISQEVFVILLISYVFMYGRDIEDVRNMVIYWEPHLMPRRQVEELAGWLKAGSSCGILKVVRNIFMMKGSMVKFYLEEGLGKWENVMDVLVEYPVINKANADCEWYIFRFEDIKLKPRKELSRLCHAWGIPWSESLMETTKYGEKTGFDNKREVISDFDLKPIYNLYEEYFSEYDRFRLSLICSPYQKKYGYPYVNLSGFSRRELQEMILKKFKVEAMFSFQDAKSELDYQIPRKKKICCMLWEARKNAFEEYVKERMIETVKCDLEHYDQIFLFDTADQNVLECMLQFCDSEQLKETPKKVLVMGVGEVKKSSNDCYRSITKQQFEVLQDIYDMYEFSNRFHLISQQEQYGSMFNYVETGILTYGEMFEALLH